ncbi:MAG: Mur ligase family protein [Acidobacteriota bacterium]|nr:Mur ligase family protein [Acidobacteriota bacterium]
MILSLADLAAPYPIQGDASCPITGVTEDSRLVAPGALFVAVRGTADDGHRFVADAIVRGAAAVAIEADASAPSGVPVVRVPDARRALAIFARRMSSDAAGALDLIGFTGTFGKTTTSHVLRRLLDAAGRRTAVVGSLGATFDGVSLDLRGMTTPSAPVLHRAFRTLVDAGANTAVMEVTSHALRMERVHGVQFAGGLIAAIRPGEHTDFHRTYEDYVESKRLFLEYLSPGAIVAYDADNRAAAMLARQRSDVRAVGFSLRRAAGDDGAGTGERRGDNTRDRRLLGLSSATLDDRGAVLTVDGVQLRSALLGRANLRNVALALTFARQFGLRMEDARDALAGLTPLRRRMERYDIAGRTVLDDTAGHPESFDAAFEVADLLPARNIIVAYALRGSRGADINGRNALSLAEHAQTLGAVRTIVTEAADTVSALDRVTPEEALAARDAFRERGVTPAWHETMADAMQDAARQSSAGDLIVLVGAQGMNAGRDALSNAVSRER